MLVNREAMKVKKQVTKATKATKRKVPACTTQGSTEGINFLNQDDDPADAQDIELYELTTNVHLIPMYTYSCRALTHVHLLMGYTCRRAGHRVDDVR